MNKEQTELLAEWQLALEHYRTGDYFPLVAMVHGYSGAPAFVRTFMVDLLLAQPLPKGKARTQLLPVHIHELEAAMGPADADPLVDPNAIDPPLSEEALRARRHTLARAMKAVEDAADVAPRTVRDKVAQLRKARRERGRDFAAVDRPSELRRVRSLNDPFAPRDPDQAD